MAANPPLESNTESVEDRIARKIALAAQEHPVVARALREEQVALDIASGLREALDATGFTDEALARQSGVSLEDISDILAANTDGHTAIVKLVFLADALGCTFDFAFVPKSASFETAIRVDTADVQIFAVETATKVPFVGNS